MTAPSVKTRILIVSDTHGKKPLQDEPNSLHDTPTQAYRDPLPRSDVAIHCGDLTMRSRVEEFEDTFSMIRALEAPLKLVIAGNHDLALDRRFWEDNAVNGYSANTLKGEVREQYLRRPDDVAAIIEAAAQDGVHFLTEGSHEFELQNGARLRVYASPMTPIYGGWAFQYPYGEHRFDIEPGETDIAITHGPPKGVLDECKTGIRAGCHELFSAVAKAKPKIHCFGHIHEAWGAELVTWKRLLDGQIRLHVDNAVDRQQTRVVDNMARLVSSEGDMHGEAEKKLQRRKKMYQDKCAPVDLSSDGPSPLRAGEQTLFVNAAVMDVRYRPTNVPWLVDIDLPKAGAEL